MTQDPGNDTTGWIALPVRQHFLDIVLAHKVLAHLRQRIKPGSGLGALASVSAQARQCQLEFLSWVSSAMQNWFFLNLCDGVGWMQGADAH